MEKNVLLQEITTESDENIIECEELLIAYLSKYPDDIEMWYKLVILELEPPLVDYERSLEYLNHIWESFKDPKALVLMASIQSIHCGFVNESVLEVLMSQIDIEKSELRALLYYSIGIGFKDDDKLDKAEFFFIKAKNDLPDFVNVYRKLYSIYNARDVVKAREYLNNAIHHVKKILKTSEILNGKNILSVESYISEVILGYIITEVNYESLSGNAKDVGNVSN